MYDIMRAQNPTTDTITFHIVRDDGGAVNKSMQMNNDGTVNIFGVGPGTIEQYAESVAQWGDESVEWYEVNGADRVML